VEIQLNIKNGDVTHTYVCSSIAAILGRLISIRLEPVFSRILSGSGTSQPVTYINKDIQHKHADIHQGKKVGLYKIIKKLVMKQF
jgi:hypothetical protein